MLKFFAVTVIVASALSLLLFFVGLIEQNQVLLLCMMGVASVLLTYLFHRKLNTPSSSSAKQKSIFR